MKKRNKIYTKLLSIALVCVMLVTSMGASRSIESEPNQEFNPNNYYHYNIDLTNLPQRYSGQDSVEAIDVAIAYVESIGLDNMGFSYIEEACLSQLEGFKEIDFNLESYTVLVPRNSSDLKYYGMRGGVEYRYAETALYLGTKTIKGETPSDNTWQDYAMGVIGLVVGVTGNIYTTVVISAVSAVLPFIGNGHEFTEGDYFEYYVRFGKALTKTVYREMSPGGYAPGFQFDESTDLIIEQWFCAGDITVKPGKAYVKEMRNGPITSEPEKSIAMSECDRGIYNLHSVIKRSIVNQVYIHEEWE